MYARTRVCVCVCVCVKYNILLFHIQTDRKNSTSIYSARKHSLDQKWQQQHLDLEITEDFYIKLTFY